MFSTFSFLQSPDDTDIPSADDTSSLESHQNGGIGLCDPELSQRRRAMLDLVNRLHATGIQFDIDLPQIAVIGSQSTGKSSLIESISGIKLPRASGTCTRCPTECKLSYSDSQWKCVVSLRFITDDNGQPLAQVHDQRFGATIYDPNEVEERIRRAQRAILSGSSNYRKFLEDDGPEAPRLSFSTNCISLQISGRNLIDLSFCDLPGIIASVGQGGNAGDIELVQDLVTSYISKPSCIILLTVACETDFENQGAHHLAKIYDPDGTRTIGVLTKPDRIPPSEENRWLRFIKGDLEVLRHGWYCVKQPNSESLSQGITWDNARSEERKYFSTTAPWSSLRTPYRERLCTDNLTERLSVLLSELISMRLPGIQVELQKLHRNTERDIQLLPKPPSNNPCQDILNLISNFTLDLSKHLEGIPEEDGLLQAIRLQQTCFQRVIKATAPIFRPYRRSHFVEGFVEEIFDKEEANRLDITNEEKGDTIFVDDVINRAQRARTRELPDVYPFVVQQSYISPVIDQWEDPALDYFEAVDKILCDHIRELTRKHFGSFGNGKLQRKVQLVVSEHIKKFGDQTKERINWLMHMERRPFTLDDQYYYRYKDDYLTFYKSWNQRGHNHSDNASTPDQTETAQIPTGSPHAGITGTNAADHMPSEAMEPALSVMASIRAYLQVAYKRFTDNIPLAVDCNFVLGVGEDISSALQEAFRIGEPESKQICQDLVQQPSDISARRERLQEKLFRLDEARKELNAFEL